MPLPPKPNKQRYPGVQRAGLAPGSQAAHAPPPPPPLGLRAETPEGSSLAEMRSFIATMQAKYGLAGAEGGSPQAPGCPSADNPLHRLHAVKERITATLASFEAPNTSHHVSETLEDEDEEKAAEVLCAAHGSLTPLSPPAQACACTCRCSEVEAEAAALKVLVADLRAQQEALRRDLEDYAASTGAVLESLQAGLRRQQGGGGGAGGRL